MPSHYRSSLSSHEDSIYVARLARGKIYAEFRRADPNLRLCVGHANMLDKINDQAMKAATERITQSQPKQRARKPRSPTRTTNAETSVRIRDVSDEYIPLSSPCNQQPNLGVSIPKGLEGDLSLTTHFTLVGAEIDDESSSSSDSDSDSDYSPPPTPTNVSVACVEIADDDCDEFGLPTRPIKTTSIRLEHAPPLLTSFGKGADDYITTGMLATLTVSEEMECGAEYWEERV
jgi:hypothetical protein